MKVSREKSAQNRIALVHAARRLFRQRGFARVTVADIAGEAGLTHGAFYGHFSSKRAIEAEALASMIEKAAADWQDVARENPDAPLRALVEGYLAFDHTSEGDVGCAFAALGADLARAEDDVRTAAARTLPMQLAVLEELFPRLEPSRRKKKALAVYAALVGAATMIRAVNDRALVDDLVRSVIDQVLDAGQA